MSKVIISEDVSKELKNALVNYNIDKRIASKTHDQEVFDFCNASIVRLCSSINRSGYLQSVMNLLEKDISECGENPANSGQAVNLTNAINNLRAENHASILTNFGNAWYSAKTGEEAATYDGLLKESVMCVPDEILCEVNQNLTIKAELEEFCKEQDGIAAAQASLTIFRFEDMQLQQDSAPQEQ